LAILILSCHNHKYNTQLYKDVFKDNGYPVGINMTAKKEIRCSRCALHY
jgi:hypothetical protein